MNDRISVIVPVYRVEAYLDGCVQSIVDQTYPHLEIILVDDGSPDNCGAMCDAWAKRDERIRVIHKPNGGLSDARNAGLEAASGAYIAFVDSDDWIEPETYAHMLDALVGENAAICACRVVSHLPESRLEWGCPGYRVTEPEETLSMLCDDAVFPVAVWNKLYRRELWRELRFPVGRLCEDAFTTCLLIHRAKRIVQIPEALYNYRVRPGSIMGSPFTPGRMDEEEAWRVNREFVREHYPKVYPAAHDFYLQKVHGLLRCIPRAERRAFSGEYTFLKNILRRNLVHIALFSRMGLKKRVRMLLDYLRL